MAALQGTILASKIVPTDSLDTYATHEDKYGRGGHRSVDTLEERDNITTPRRKEGMTVYVKENKTKYILENGIENVNWKVDKIHSHSTSDITGLDVTLSNKVGAGLDPCAAIQILCEIADGEEREIIFTLGVGRDHDDARNLVLRNRGVGAARQALQAVKDYWKFTPGTVKIKSPDIIRTFLLV